MKTITVRNKNALKELLLHGATFQKIAVVHDLARDSLTDEIFALAKKRQVRIEVLPLRKMSKRRSGHTREMLAGFLVPSNFTTLSQLLDTLHKEKRAPFLLLINRLDFPSNIGVIARTAFAAGVDGLIFQGDEDLFFNDETLHFSLGAIARLPLIKMSIFEALKVLKKEGVQTLCLDMHGVRYDSADLRGPAAFVLGAEGEGISKEVASRCDTTLSLPMRKGIDSLNVGISAGVMMYEKVRQDRLL